MTTPHHVADHQAVKASPFAGEDVCQAAGLSIDPDRASVRPVFDQDVWDFTSVLGLPRHQVRNTQVLDFTRIKNPAFRLAAKEYLFALMAPGHERVRVLPRAYRAPRVISTVNQRMFNLIRWFEWLTGRGVHDLAKVTQEMCDAFLLWCQHSWKDGRAVKETSRAYRRQAVNAVLELADYGELLTAGGYAPGFRPWPGRSAEQVAGSRRRGENATQPVNDDVLQPLLAAAFYVIEHLAPHVLLLREVEGRRDADLEHRFAQMKGQLQWAPLITAVISDYVRRADPLPATSDEQIRYRLGVGWSPNDPLLRVSSKQIALETGIRFPKALKILNDHRAELEAAVAAVGVEHPTARRAPLVAKADGKGEVPWTLPLPAHSQVNWLIERVRTACVVVVAAVTGMRMSEICELPADCLLPPDQVAEGLARYRVKSKRIKGIGHGGVWDEWVVVEDVYKALDLMRKLLDDPDTETHLIGQGKLQFNSRCTTFRQWVNGADGQRLGLAPIPDGPVSLRMLRRTLALELAHRPGGLLAAKVALKHVSVATTEGYAARPGGTQSLFLAEVGKEEQNRNLQLTRQAFEDYRNGVLPAGPGARDLVEFFESVDADLSEQAKAAPNVKRGDREVLSLLAKRAKTLHLGVANYCWFADPAKALCLKLAGAPVTEDAKPMAGLCDSARCPQATHHPCHRPVWASSAENKKVFIGSITRGQKTERARLQADLDRDLRVLAEIDAATGLGD
ncbi:site-specific integrase [Kitasatospora sp. NPDC101155]|uniref:site-specific integrase n=1 Tax=Kitasatospora sp. NPDC101155 TaxID=3364097 RepID=UPI00382017E0